MSPAKAICQSSLLLRANLRSLHAVNFRSAKLPFYEATSADEWVHKISNVPKLEEKAGDYALRQCSRVLSSGLNPARPFPSNGSHDRKECPGQWMPQREQ